ncbi:MAG: ACT domain-containing protein [Gammaproteobacteria bacterium]
MNEPSHILTVVTPDKRGIIAALTEILDRNQVTVLELSQTVVRDYFTIIIVIRVPAESDHEQLTAMLEATLADGASLSLLDYKPSPRSQQATGAYMLTANGAASTGVLHTISALIAERGGNFTDLSSRIMAQEMNLVAEIDLPKNVALDQLQIDLEHAGSAVGLTVRLQHQRLFQATNEIAFRRLPKREKT